MVALLPHLLPKTDPRYIKWRNSLKNRPSPWNKGKNKDNNESVKHISDTFKRKKINNFAHWRNQMIASGKIKTPQPLIHSYSLAVLIGLVLGDGHIQVFPRTQRLTISLNTKYPNLISYTCELIENIFDKKPYPEKMKDSNCIRVSIYQKEISERIGIITGNRSKDTIGVPAWIFAQKEYIIGCLKGLFEAEGSLSIHIPTCTYNFQFSNKSCTLLDQVKTLLIQLKFHPEVRSNAIRLRKKLEVQQFKDLIQFREY